ncbi:MAG: hypothetical protein IKR34_01805 [Candidatus Gastranaerophilales bacterium]|nr:hypothetical protein [Candidatus Gastranaerophilales bacterium]
MLSEYFKIVTDKDIFKNHCSEIFDELKGKRVLLYGAGEAYFALDKIYNFKEKFDIIGIADLKFASKDKKVIKENQKKFKDIKMINPEIPENIEQEEFDYLLITNEYARPILRFLKEKFDIDENKIRTLFVQEIKDESINLSDLYKHKFEKTLPKLKEKLKDKKVLLYGAGVYLEIIKKYFDLSGLDVIGIADRKYSYKTDENEFLGYKTYSVDKIKELNPDYVIVSTKKYIDIITDLYENVLKDTKIKIKPLVKKSFWSLFKEAMN